MNDRTRRTTTPFRKKRKSFNEPGHAHFVTFSCSRRQPLLGRDRSRQWVIDALLQARESHNVHLWAYVIMPEHLHVLVHPQDSAYEMRHILAAIKRPVSDAARQHLTQTKNAAWLERLMITYPSRQVFRFWQPGGGFDRNIFLERSIPAVIDYIHENPVRRGLVHQATEWPWSSARFWAGETDVPLKMDRWSA